MIRRALSFFLGLGFASVVLAWNAPGHCVVALIAYDQLTPQAKQKLDALVQAIPSLPGQTNTICTAANWPDMIRGQNINAFTNWHFIDQRLTLSGKAKRKYHIPQENIVWAIGQAEQVLVSPSAQDFEKAWFLRFFLHFVGDIHQPLHTVSLFNAQFPRGDKGGNLYWINSPIADNLHALWDQGVGLVPDNMHRDAVRALAKSLQQRYPKSYFDNQMDIQNPWIWAEEGMRIAKADVYQIPYQGTPSQAYINQGQQIAAEQLTLAGYRLGYLLNLWASGKLPVANDS